MPKDTKTLGNSKARACESLGFVHKKDCARVLTHLLIGSRDDKIRTCDHTPPRRVLYRAELHPELRLQK